MDSKKTSLIFKALGDEMRVKILYQLMEGEQCACHLLKKQQITQPALSHHMQILCASGLVESQRVGRWTHYAMSRQGMDEAQGIIQKFLLKTEKDPFCNTGCC